MNPTITPKKSYRLDTPNITVSDFHIVHGRQPANPRHPFTVELGEQVPGVDEATVPVPAGYWAQVKRKAVEYGCEHAEDVMSPVQTVGFTNALRTAVEVEKDAELKRVMQKVIQICLRGRGLRVV